MGERKFKPSGTEVAKLIHHYLGELYPQLEIDVADIEKLVVPSDSRGSDIKFKAEDFCDKYSCDHEKVMRELYLKLTSESDKDWYNRSFYGMFKREGSIYFRLVDDSTT